MFKILPIIALVIISFQTTKADKLIEYSTTFNTTQEQDAWSIIRESGESMSEWGFNAMPNDITNKYASHDYNVGGEDNDTTKDWLVSPKLIFHKGAKLEFKYSLFAMMGGRLPEDKFQVYFCSGNSDPYDATYTLIKELSDSIIGSELTTTEFELPYSDTPGVMDSCYVAFYLQATWNWYIPGVDDVNVYYMSSGIEDDKLSDIQVLSKYNSTDPIIEIHSKENLGGLNISIYDIFGREVFTAKCSSNDIIGLSNFTSGAYFYKLSSPNKLLKSGKLMI